jgi:hypothetical protein
METGITKEPAHGLGPTSGTEVTYGLTQEDYAACFLHYYDHAVARRRGDPRYVLRLVAFWMGQPVIIWLGFAMVRAYLEYRMDPFPILIMPVFFALLEILLLADVGRRLLRPSARDRRLREFLRQMAPIVSGNPKTRLSLLPDYLLVVTDSRFAEPGIVCRDRTELRLAWSVVDHFALTESHVFIVYNPGKQAIILPRGAFPDRAAFRRFLDTAEDYRTKALLAAAPSQALNTAPEDRFRPAGG